MLGGTDVKLILLHDTRADDAIRSFFTDVWELYVKMLMNPFAAVDGVVGSAVFDTRVRAAGRKWL